LPSSPGPPCGRRDAALGLPPVPGCWSARALGVPVIAAFRRSMGRRRALLRRLLALRTLPIPGAPRLRRRWLGRRLQGRGTPAGRLRGRAAALGRAARRRLRDLARLPLPRPQP